MRTVIHPEYDGEKRFKPPNWRANYDYEPAD